ncbi:MAG: hypothetical protein V4642_04940 [Bacteroidota bacterium]
MQKTFAYSFKLSEQNIIITMLSSYIIITGILLFIQISISCGQSIIDTESKRYDVETGYIEMLQYVDNQPVLEYKLHFTEFGSQRHLLRTFIKDTIRRRITITTKDYLYEFTPGSDSVDRVKLTGRISMLINDGTPFLPTEMKEVIKSDTAVKLPQKKISGFGVPGYFLTMNGLSARVWVHNNIPVYIEDIDGNKLFEVITLNTNINIPNDYFIIPDSAKVIELQLPIFDELRNEEEVPEEE